MHLQRPFWLLLLPLGIWLVLKLRRAEDPLRGWRLQMDAELLEALKVGEGTGSTVHLGFLLAGWCLLVLSVAGPVWRQIPSPFAEDTAAIVVLLKADTSMSDDVTDPSPLLESQLKIQDLVDVRPGGKLALIVYAGSAHLVLPATKDAQVVADLAMEISPEIMPQKGDDLPSAIRRAGALLKDDPNGGSLLVLADRVEASASEVKDAWRAADSPGVQFLSLLPEVDVGLKAAAQAVKAEVVSLTPDEGDVKAIARSAERQLQKGNVAEGQQWAEDGWWLILPAAFLFLFQFCKTEEST